MPQIADQSDVVLIGADLGRGNRAADANFNIAIVLVEKFMRKQRRPHSGMQESEQLEQRAVGADEVNGQHCGAGDPDQASHAVVPFRIDDGAFLQI